MTEPTELLPCPFCGAGESQIHVNKGTWNGRGYGEPVSVEVRHWCADVPGQPSRMISRAGRDEASAIDAWNTRATQPTLAQAGAREPLTDSQAQAETPCRKNPFYHGPRNCSRGTVGCCEDHGVNTHPQAGAVPLTDEQWQRIADLTDSILTRATKDEIERVIGIKGGQHGAE